MEVGLAITIGTVLAAAGVLAYTHARDAAGASIARQKVADLQIMVEDYYSRYNVYPPLGGTTANQGLMDIWLANRADALKSPWGGDVVLAEPFGLAGFDGNPGTEIPTNPSKVVGGPADTNCPNDPPPTGKGEKCGNRKNNMIYMRFAVPGLPPDTCSPCWNLWDAGLKSYASVSAYAVAANKEGRAFFFVTSGKMAL